MEVVGSMNEETESLCEPLLTFIIQPLLRLPRSPPSKPLAPTARKSGINSFEDEEMRNTAKKVVVRMDTIRKSVAQSNNLDESAADCDAPN